MKKANAAVSYSEQKILFDLKQNKKLKLNKYKA